MSRCDIEKVLVEEQEIKQKVCEMGAALSDAYRGSEKPPVFICVLKGAFIFAADLVRAMDIDVEMDFLRVASYGSGKESSGKIKFVKDIETDIDGRDVVILEDIIDTGITLFELKKILKARNPKSLAVAVLLNKPEGRKADIEPDYECFEVEDRFIVGCGLDYDEKFRGLRYIACID